MLITTSFSCAKSNKQETENQQDRLISQTEVTDSPTTIVHEELPAGAEKVDETAKRALYTKVEKEASEEEPVNTVSVWIEDKETHHATRLFTTNPLSEPLWNQMKDNMPVEVALEDIAAADAACFIPFDTSKILVEGCPDSRNIWSYVVDLKTKTAKQFCSSEGLILFDEKAKTIVLGFFLFHEEGGRYSVARTFTLDGTFVKEEVIGDE